MSDDEADDESRTITVAETPEPKSYASGHELPSVARWPNAREIPSRTYTCGYCGNELASNRGFLGVGPVFQERVAAVYICHNCKRPTYIHFDGRQAPAPMIGDDVEHLSGPVATLYWEARVSASRGANTAAAMCCRKLLLNVAAALAEDDFEPGSFKQAVDWLEEEGHIPEKGKRWVERIRKVGNEANHEIDRTVDPREAERLLTFTEGLLRDTFELPHKLEQAARSEESEDSPP